MRIGATDLGEEFQAADAGHLEVRNDGVEALVLQSYEGFFARSGGRARERGRLQHDGQKFAGCPLIIDSQNADKGAAIAWYLRRDGLANLEKTVVSNGHGYGASES
jgi:hypothetical protein